MWKRNCNNSNSSFQKIEDLELEVKEKNREVLSRDRVINDLRLRLPVSAERDKLIVQATMRTTGKAPKEEEDVDYESRQAVRVAQSTVHHLQVCLYLIT